MKVKAKMMGYYQDSRVREGEVFELKDEKHFSERWMEKVDADAEAPKAEAPAEEKESDESSEF